jgi:rhodanese-related sulfurtransferase
MGADIRLISPDTLHRLIHGEFRDKFDNFLIIDTRFPYEYDGGHIKGAHNFWDTTRANRFILSHEKSKIGLNFDRGERTAIVLHCEFSSHRAPTMYRHIRNLDRHICFSVFPKLILPEMYVLEKGYKEHFAHHPEDTEDQLHVPNYQPMEEKRFKAKETEYETRMRHSFEIAKDEKWECESTVHELERIVTQYGIQGIEREHHMQRSRKALSEKDASPATPKGR